MPEDFLKKIGNKKNSQEENPFDKIFQSKQNEVKPVIPVTALKEDAPNSMDGIENLGKYPTSKERYVEKEVKTEPDPAIITEAPRPQPVFNEPVKSGPNDFELEAQPRGLEPEDKIPAQSIENADIFASPHTKGNFLSNVSSSVNNLSFDDEKKNESNTDLLIGKVAELLRQNKKDDAVKFILENFKKQDK